MHPRLFRPVACACCGPSAPRRSTRSALPRTLPCVGYYCLTWLIGGVGALLPGARRRRRPPVSSIPFLGGASRRRRHRGGAGGVRAVRAWACARARPTACSDRRRTGAALGAVILNRLVITLVEAALFLVAPLPCAGSASTSTTDASRAGPSAAATVRMRSGSQCAPRSGSRCRVRRERRGRGRGPRPTVGVWRCRSRAAPSEGTDALAARSIAVAGDLLETPPRAYRDYGAEVQAIADLQPGERGDGARPGGVGARAARPGGATCASSRPASATRAAAPPPSGSTSATCCTRSARARSCSCAARCGRRAAGASSSSR